MSDHVDEVMYLLDIDKPYVITLGIWGMAGSGKTTIAKFIYNQLMHKFDYCSFIGDISERSKSKGMELLLAQLFSDVLGRQIAEFFDLSTKKYKLGQRFHNKKLLIVLDDVDQAEETEALLRILWPLLDGSRIIVTTRNKNVLEAQHNKPTYIYEVKEMDEENALLLFCKRAFRQDFMLPEYDNLSREIVKAIGGIPLALEIVASYLSSHLKNKAIWVEELRRLKRNPKIQEKLRVSADSLNHEEREIFLDIACLFHGMDWRIPVSLWRARGLFPARTIHNLLSMSLIKITEGSNLWMHNLLRDLGREIVRAENCDEPGKRSRLWRSEDGIEVLEYEEGTAKVQAICLACNPELEHRCFSGEEFSGLSHLLFLDLGFANLNGGFEKRLWRLKWISWHGIGQNQLSLPSEFHLRDLVVLDLSESSTEESWGGWNLIQEAKKLEVLNLKNCQQLRSTPHFNSFVSLKRLILEDCHELSIVHSSIGQLTALESLTLKNCWSLERLPDELGSLLVLTELVIDKVPIESLPEGMANLETLSAKSCESLKVLSLSDYKSLKKLNLSRTPVVQLSFSGRQPRNLQELDISYSSISSFLPLMELHMLEVINASGCQSLEGDVPTELVALTSLRILRMDNTRVTSIPDGIRNLCHLEVLDLWNSKCEETLPDLPTSLVNVRVTCRSSMTVIPNLSDLINLKELEFLECSKLDQLPKGIKFLSKLRRLKLQSTSIVSFPEEIGELCQLREIIISDCDRLESLPKLPSGLRRLMISRSSLEVLPNFSSLQMLKGLFLRFCPQLEDIEGLGELEWLEELRLERCDSLVALPDLSRLQKLKRLVVSCALLKVIKGLGEFEWLEELRLHNCNSLVALPNLSRLKKLKILELISSPQLEDIEGLDELEWLEELCLRVCISLVALPNLSRLQKLKRLVLSYCPQLEGFEGLGELKWLEELRLTFCNSIVALPNLSRLRKLTILELHTCERLKVIQGLGELDWLEELCIERCDSLDALPNMSRLQKLRILVIRFCERLRDIQGLRELELLEKLSLDYCNSLEVLPNFSRLHKLKRLVVGSFALLEVIKEGLGELEFLEELRIDNCSSLEALPNLCMHKLKILVLSYCPQLEDIERLDELEWLEGLRLESCNSLVALPNLFKLHKLKKLVLSYCPQLEDFEGLNELKWLEELHIERCDSLDALPNLSRLQKLRILELRFCERLKVIQGLCELDWLEALRLEGCDSLEALPNMSRLQRMKKLHLESCKQLKDIEGLRMLEDLQYLWISECPLLNDVVAHPRQSGFGQCYF